jgi:hypothetical protein
LPRGHRNKKHAARSMPGGRRWHRASRVRRAPTTCGRFGPRSARRDGRRDAIADTRAASGQLSLGVGSEEAPIEELASVRHSNGTCSFPAFRFHEWLREVRREGISETRLPCPPESGPSASACSGRPRPPRKNCLSWQMRGDRSRRSTSVEIINPWPRSATPRNTSSNCRKPHGPCFGPLIESCSLTCNNVAGQILPGAPTR